MIKAVLFDMDGVLIDTEKYLTQFWQQAAAEAGLSLTMEDCYQFRSFASKFASVAFQEKYGKEYDYFSIRARRKKLMKDHIVILSILVYTFFSRMFDLMLPPVAKHSIVVA